jgi:hypothetical protein
MVLKYSQQHGRSSPSHSQPRGQRIGSIRYLPNGIMLQVDAPYDKGFTDSLKTSLPSKKRIWDANDKCWYVVKDQFDRLSHLMGQYFDDVLLFDFPAQEVSTDAWAVLHLTPNAPMQVVQAAYKALAKMHHSDLGGDDELMKAVNVSYKQILGELVNGD